jgi:DNA repair photolyase
VRWDNLRIAADDEHRLPGYRDPAVVRTFDAPEALDVRFYEVRARSALNRVPKASRMPFRWTINPYRGCTHACVYCLAGDTPILMADGRTRPLAEVRPGDSIYGTSRQGAYRRLVETEVLAHWSTTKPAYRVVLEDGTELVASGDHRFLTRRGWKHVTGAEQGRARRPHLTPSDELLGVGAFAPAPVESADYRLGYLCGMVRGDGHVASCAALELRDAYLAARDIAAHEFAFEGARTRVVSIARTSQCPREPSEDWCRGLLAGVFDREGRWADGGAQIESTDFELQSWVTASLRCLDFGFLAEPPAHPGAPWYVRVGGGIGEQARFVSVVAPATACRYALDGCPVEARAALRVAFVEPLGLDLPLFDITTGTGDFIANGVVSHNCFARPTHTYLDFDAGRDFEREIVVKVNVPEVLRTELARPSWTREHVALGTNTDPYQWVEARYKLMPGIWEAFRDFANPCSILTKSPLVLRDLPLLQEVAAVADVGANLSVPTLDERAWRASEPHTPHPRARLEAVAELNRAGIPTGILIAPLMPGINDDPAQVERILEIAGEAGAVGISGIPLHLRREVREVFMDWLRGYRPDLVPRYEALYARGAYVRSEERRRIQELVGRHSPPPPRMRGRPRPPARADPAAPPEGAPAVASPGADVTQPTLF